MKRCIIVFMLLATSAFSFAEGLSERVFINTDRQVYVAGDKMMISAFCMDASTGKPSSFSSIAYLELHSSDGMAQTGKIALYKGRGAGILQLQKNLPTGNYRIIAYTSQNKNEVGFNYASGSRIISIINASSTERVKDGVDIVDISDYKGAPVLPSEGNISISLPEEANSSSVVLLALENAGKDADVSVSVWHDDGLISPANTSLADFLSTIKPGTEFCENAIPEFEGEIISAKVVGNDPSQVSRLEGLSAFISASGSESDVYSAAIERGGAIKFFTNNIYEDKELVCQIESLPEDYACHIELESPFVNANVGEGIPNLKLCPDFADQISVRSAASQIINQFEADTLYELLPMRKNLLFGDEVIRYDLDDYTRFPTMEEIFVEFVGELRARKGREDMLDIQIKLQNVFRSTYFSNGTSLVMLDGVPVFDHRKIMDYDPLLVKSINIFPYIYFVGERSFNGIVNFETYKGNLPTMEFNDDVRIIDFKGPSYPLAYTCPGVSLDPAFPDYRQTAYWHPILKVGANNKAELEVALPAYKGSFVVVVEGIDSDGSAIRAEKRFEVK